MRSLWSKEDEDKENKYVIKENEYVILQLQMSLVVYLYANIVSF